MILGNGLVVDALVLTVVLSLLPLGTSLVVGLVVAVLQAATQIQEQTLTFVPKVVAVGAVLWFSGEWMFAQLVEYLTQTLEQLSSLPPSGL